MGRISCLVLSAFLVVDHACGREPIALPMARGWRSAAADGLQFSPDGKWLVAAMNKPTRDRADDKVLVWDVSSREQVTRFASPDGKTKAIAMSPVVNLLATCHQDSIRLWNFEQGWKEVQSQSIPRPNRKPDASGEEMGALAFSPDGRLLACAWEDASVTIWDVQTRALIDELPIQTRGSSYGGVLRFATSKQLVIRTNRRQASQQVQLWNLEEKRAKSLSIPRGGIGMHFDVSPNAKQLVMTVRSDGPSRVRRPSKDQVWTWDLETGNASRVGPGLLPQLFSPRFSADGRFLAIGVYENPPPPAPCHVMLLNGKTRRPAKQLRLARRGTCPAHFAFSPDGRYLAAVVLFDPTPVYLWTVDDSKSVAAP